MFFISLEALFGIFSLTNNSEILYTKGIDYNRIIRGGDISDFQHVFHLPNIHRWLLEEGQGKRHEDVIAGVEDDDLDMEQIFKDAEAALEEDEDT